MSHELAGGGILDVGCYTTSMAHLVAAAAAGVPVVETIDVSGGAVIGPTGVDHSAAATLVFGGERPREGRVLDPSEPGQRGADRRIGGADHRALPVAAGPDRRESSDHRGTVGAEPEVIDDSRSRPMSTPRRGGSGQRCHPQGRALEPDDAVGGFAREHAHAGSVAGRDRSSVPGTTTTRRGRQTWRRSRMWRRRPGCPSPRPPGCSPAAGTPSEDTRQARARGREGARLRAEPDRPQPPHPPDARCSGS